jgi:hypothetical protein
MIQAVETKRCTKCGEGKALSEFGKNRRNKDGLQYSCKECHNVARKQYNLAHPDRARETARRCYLAHRQERLAYAMRYTKAHPHQRKATLKRYYNSHREQIKRSAKQHKAKYPERVAASRRRYEATHREQKKAYYKERCRSAKRGASGKQAILM